MDGFSDVHELLSSEAAEALEKIKERAPLQPRLVRRPQRTYMAIPLAMADPVEFDLVIAFGPYSIHTEVVDGDGAEVLVLHDTSTGIEVRVEASTAAVIASDLPSGLLLEP